MPADEVIFGLPFVGVGGTDSDFLRMRSYSAARREVVGVAGTVSASAPVWCTGVEGLEEVGVDGTDEEVLVLGVEGKAMREVRGVLGVDNAELEAEDRMVEGVVAYKLDVRAVEGVL